MSDPNDRERGGRRRRRRAGRKERDREQDTMALPTKSPIILAKPHGDQSLVSVATTGSTSASNIKSSDKPIVVLKARDGDGRPSTPASSLHNIPAAITGEITPHAPYQIHRTTGQTSDSDGQNRLAAPPEMTRCLKLVDDLMHWCDVGMEIVMRDHGLCKGPQGREMVIIMLKKVLVDQTDFFVIGVLGMQGTGKSTLLSLLAGNLPQDPYRSFVFQPQSKDTKEVGAHQTSGVDMFVTNDRIILLDAQPVLSASVLDFMIHHDKKYPTEYTSAENCIEMQSLQIAAFMMTVCNVVLVIQDWFADVNFLRFLLTAEMLKPSTPASGHDGASAQETSPDYYPQIVFVQNKAMRDDFSVENFKAMQATLLKIFNSSRLKYRGSVTLASGELLPGLNSKTINTDVNLFLLPTFDNQRVENDPILTLLPEYRGYPSFSILLQALRNQVLASSRYLLTHTSLSERNWFHYAARTWDTVKKSSLMSEYNRLLP